MGEKAKKITVNVLAVIGALWVLYTIFTMIKGKPVVIVNSGS